MVINELPPWLAGRELLAPPIGARASIGLARAEFRPLSTFFAMVRACLALAKVTAAFSCRFLAPRPLRPTRLVRLIRATMIAPAFFKNRP